MMGHRVICGSQVSKLTQQFVEHDTAGRRNVEGMLDPSHRKSNIRIAARQEIWRKTIDLVPEEHRDWKPGSPIE